MDKKQAQILNDAFPDSELHIIENMNHIFKTVGEDEVVASKSYVDSNFLLNTELIDKVSAFVLSNWTTGNI